MAMMCNALLAARSAPRLSRCLTVFPDDAGTGLTPHSDAKLASDRSLSGLSPAVRRSCAAPVWPIELRATRFGANSSTMAWSGPLGADEDQAADLTAGRGLRSSNCCGLR